MTEENKIIIELIISSISLLLSLIAIVITIAQLVISNKQSLFDKRIKLYSLANDLCTLYNENKGSITNRKDEVYFECETVFSYMTNNSNLAEASKVINNTLKQTEQFVFLSKIENLKKEGNKTRFLFKGKTMKYVEMFVNDYADALMGLYQYKVLLDDMKKYSANYEKVDLEKAIKDFKEPEHRKTLFAKLDKLNNTFELMNKSNCMKRMENKIKLY